MQGPADPDMSLGDAARIVQMDHFYHKPVIRLSVCNPPRYSGRDIESFPFAGIVVHQSGVQKSRDGVLGGLPLRLDYFININTMERATVVFQGTSEVLPENLKLSRSDQLPAWDRRQVEEETPGCPPTSFRKLFQSFCGEGERSTTQSVT